MSPKEFSQRIGSSVKTLQRWDNAAKIKAYRSPTNRRFYTEDQYNDFMGLAPDDERIDVIYARVSSNGQKDDLKHQTEFLKQYCDARDIIISEVVTDIGLWFKTVQERFRR